jgi:phosphomannomutase
MAETLGPLMQAVRAHGADIGIAFDGDGDRIALVDSNGEFVSSQETFAMLAMYLGERDDVTDGAIVRSVNGSVRLDLLAERYNVPLIETPIGYAHIAPAMIEHQAMLGGEESGGFAFGTHLPERDAFVAALYLLDLMQRRGTDVAGLRYGVEIRTGAWHYRRQDVPLAAEAMDEARARLAAVETSGIDLVGSPVVKRVTLDGIKLIGEDRRWLLVRTSGTEPLARIYAEARAPETVESLIALGQALLTGEALPASTAPPAASENGASSAQTEPREPARQRVGRSRTYTRRH